ncbi:DUF3427 domain-containing protein [Planomonospora parontospora]|uniref:DUF3427 domain-containing protein n=1 Tax=Planomonospora parontospora TaxID=58119 RepID=UPI001670C940|nr:DUF3427 domain-containing protein [Planomonospora parontospora]
MKWQDLVRELRQRGDITLPRFLEETGLELEDLYRRREGWTALRRAAGLEGPAADAAADKHLGRAFGRMLHIDDAERLDFLRAVLNGDAHPISGRRSRLLAMAEAALWGSVDSCRDVATRLARINEVRAAELAQLVDILQARALDPAAPLDPAVPLRVHARYSKNETLAAFGLTSFEHMRQGVLYVPAHKADLFFVTIDKAENQYSKTTLYNDYAITEDRFHWESQSTLHADAPTAHRYIGGQSTAHLLLRPSKRDTGLGAPPYVYAGPVSYIRHDGERPIRFVWQLAHPLPPEVFQYAARA